MKRGLSFIIFISFALISKAQLKSAVDSVYYLLDTTMHIMQRKALNADQVDWAGLSSELKKKQHMFQQ